MASPIPTFHRVFFTMFDPLLAGFGVFANVVNPELVLGGFTPKPRIPPSPETTVLLHGMAGFFGMLVILQVVLLRLRPHDVTVWRCVQAGILVQDLLMILGFVTEMRQTRRLDTKHWSGNDWANITLYPALALIRASFIVSIAGSSGSGDKKAKRV